MQKLYIHIGINKTATSYIQENFYLKHPEINYLGRSKKLKQKTNLILKLDDLLNASNCKVFTKKCLINNISTNKFKLIENKINLLSNEGFARATKTNTRYRRNILAALKNLDNFFSKENEIIYILTIRNQQELIKSIMLNFYRYNKVFNFNLKDINKILNNESNKNKFILDNFKYFKIIDFIKKKMNREILVYLYEDIKYNKKEFFRKMSEDLGIETYVPNEPPLNTSKNKKNKLVISFFKKITANITKFNILKSKEYFKKVIYYYEILNPMSYIYLRNNKIKKYFQRDNLKLAKYLNLESKFKKYNYLDDDI